MTDEKDRLLKRVSEAAEAGFHGLLDRALFLLVEDEAARRFKDAEKEMREVARLGAARRLLKFICVGDKLRYELGGVSGVARTSEVVRVVGDYVTVRYSDTDDTESVHVLRLLVDGWCRPDQVPATAEAESGE